MADEAPYAGETPNSKRRQSITSPESNPPDELRDIYRQIDEGDSLTDLEGPDDFEVPGEEELENRVRRLSSGPALGENGGRGGDVFSDYDANLLDDITDRRTLDYGRDEGRLQRAMASRSPVFSRARVGKEGLTSENLQRRDEEVRKLDDEKNGDGPSLNLPSGWGSRATKSRDWLRNINGDESRSEKKESTGNLGLGLKAVMDSSVRPSSASERSPRRSHLTRGTLGERIHEKRPRTTSANESKKPSLRTDRSAEDNIPNTPTVGYKTSTFNKPSPTKRDSQQLLRRLSRNQSPSQDQNEARTPEPQKPQSKVYDKTPVVTGAWIDTPVTERPQFSEHLAKGLDSMVTQSKDFAEHAEPVKRPQQNEGSQREQSRADEKPERQPQPAKEKTRPQLIKPKLPKSGLETVIEDAKADKDSFPMGDDTIESLQMMLNEKPTETKTEEEEEAESKKAILEKLEFAKSKGKDQVDLDRLNDKLQSLVQNINEVKKGLNGLEDQVSRDALLASRPSSPNGGKKAQHVHTGENCEACGARSDGHAYAAIPLPRLWKRDPSSQRVCITRLGWCTLIFLAWFFSESTMCDYYCHPLIANVCSGNCLMHDAPQFPFVIPTMLWRWSNLSAILAPVSTLLLALFRLATQLLGLSDGYVDDVPRALNLSGEVRIRGSQVMDLPAVTAPSRNFLPKNLRQRTQTQTQTQTPVLAPTAPSLNLHVDDDASMDEDEYIA